MDNSNQDKKYSFEEILEMFEGYKYYSEATIKYIFHNVNGNEKEAEYYLAICQEENKKLIDAVNKIPKEEI